MEQEFFDPVGGAWLVARYGLQLVQPLATASRIGTRRATHESGDGRIVETYTASARPDESLRGHLTFYFKHETPHLEMLSRLFAAVDARELTAWLVAEPFGQYARRAGFLYEFFTGRELDFAAAKPGGNYVDALPSDRMVTATGERVSFNRRWRVRDNMPGTRFFCPTIRKTPAVLAALALDVPGLLHDLATEFGDDLLMRSAVWLTLRESRSSFAIEGEAGQADRVARFADVMARKTGQGDWPLDDATLAALQAEILGKRTSLRRFGVRQSPVFVGETAHFQEVVHYIAPPSADAAPMLDGLRVFLDRTAGHSAVLRAAVAAFGFVYIHPLADGNGRVHRFLINDSLRRDGAIAEPMILPVSAHITDNPQERAAYDRTLDSFSAPLMRHLAGSYAFAQTATPYPDGIHSNLLFHGEEIARPVWRAPDLGAHVVWLSQTLSRVIQEDMRSESIYLRNLARARAAIKEIVEMPDAQIDRAIRSCQSNRGELSNALAKEIPVLREAGVWESLREAILQAFG